MPFNGSPLPLNAGSTCKVTSALTSASVALLPGNGSQTLDVYNAGANPVHLSASAVAVVPGATFTPGVMTVSPGSTQTFSIGPNTTVVSFIAETAGGALYLTIGDGL